MLLRQLQSSGALAMLSPPQRKRRWHQKLFFFVLERTPSPQIIRWHQKAPVFFISRAALQLRPGSFSVLFLRRSGDDPGSGGPARPSVRPPRVVGGLNRRRRRRRQNRGTQRSVSFFRRSGAVRGLPVLFRKRRPSRFCLGGFGTFWALSGSVLFTQKWVTFKRGISGPSWVVFL